MTLKKDVLKIYNTSSHDFIKIHKRVENLWIMNHLTLSLLEATFPLLITFAYSLDQDQGLTDIMSVLIWIQTV